MIDETQRAVLAAQVDEDVRRLFTVQQHTMALYGEGDASTAGPRLSEQYAAEMTGVALAAADLVLRFPEAERRDVLAEVLAACLSSSLHLRQQLLQHMTVLWNASDTGDHRWPTTWTPLQVRRMTLTTQRAFARLACHQSQGV